MADLRQMERKLARLEREVALYRLGFGLALVLCVALSLLLAFGRTPRYGRAILVDNQVVAMVKNEAAAAEVRRRLLEAGKGGFTGSATFREKWEDATRPAEGAEVISISQAVTQLRGKVSVVVEACAIEANGQRLLVVPSREIADSVLAKLKSRFTSQADAVVKSTKLQPEPTIRPVTVAPAEIVTDILQGLQQLSDSHAAPQDYAVRAGDYPERIASRHDMKISDLYRLNPGLRGSTLRVGQKVKVYGAGTGLTTITVKETAATVLITPPVKKVPTAGIAPGAIKTVSPGKPGTKRIRCEVVMRNAREVRRRVISEEILSEPEPRVVQVSPKSAP